MTSEQLPLRPLAQRSALPADAPLGRRSGAARWLTAQWPALALALLTAILFDLLTGGAVTTVLDPWVRAHAAALTHTGPDLVVAHVLDNTGKITVVTPVLAVAAAWASWRQRSWSSLQLVAGTLLAMLALLTVVKFGLARGLAVNGDPSLFVPGGQAFPSGHGAQAALAAALLVVLVPRVTGRPLRRSSALLLVALPCSVMTTVSLYLGYHWLSDLVAGTLVGLLSARTGLAVERRAQRRRACHVPIGVPPLDLVLGRDEPADAQPFDVRDDAEIAPPAPHPSQPSASVAA